MTNKRKAATFVALYTAGMISVIVAINIVLNYLQPTLAEMGVLFAVLMLAFAMKMMYDLRLSQLDSKDRLDEITKTNPTLK